MNFEAPAKLNLSLKVLGKREDGFHELDMVMVPLPGLHDVLSIERSDVDSFTCNIEDVPLDESNLVIRARDLFRQSSGIDQPLAIHLEKKVPHGAGLGGGSSDAAVTLRSLDEMLGASLGSGHLHELAAAIGSDVPFFLKPSVARVRGRGELLGPGPAVPSLPVLLLKPRFGVSTPDAYGGWKDAVALPGVAHEPQGFDWGDLVNDLELPVFQKFPFLAEMKMWLLRQDGVRGALMSGSGSTVFAVLDDSKVASSLTEAARAELDPTLWSWSGLTGV